MKNLLIGILATSILFQCSHKSGFESINCETSDTNYMVFKPCRQYIFNARIWGSDNNLISEGRIWMMATGKPWEYQPDSQNELIIQYEFDPSKIDEIVEASINQDLVSQSWQKQEVTGIIENEEKIWMHPFRSNQYAFTEVAPFPEVVLPLEVGQTWLGGTLHIYDGWGEWSNSTLTDYYEVVGFDRIELSYSELEAWHINSYSEATFGNSTHNFWFHDQLGFVKMIIHNYTGQTLQIELENIID